MQQAVFKLPVHQNKCRLRLNHWENCSHGGKRFAKCHFQSISDAYASPLSPSLSLSQSLSISLQMHAFSLVCFLHVCWFLVDLHACTRFMASDLCLVVHCVMCICLLLALDCCWVANTHAHREDVHEH